MSAAPKPTLQERVAVALHYDFEGAPTVVAKGRGSVAQTIIETARANDVAVEENPLLAETLAQVELDHEIPETLYRAVAQVLTFVLQSRTR